MNTKNYNNWHIVKTYVKILLLFITINLGTISLFSQSVTFQTPFHFGEIIVVPPGVGSVTLTGLQRTPSGNVIIIPSRTGPISLATFVYTHKGANNTLTWADVRINPISITPGMTISGIVITSSPALPYAIKNNNTVTFTVTSARLNTTVVPPTVASPPPITYSADYSVTILGNTFP